LPFFWKLCQMRMQHEAKLLDILYVPRNLHFSWFPTELYYTVCLILPHDTHKFISFVSLCTICLRQELYQQSYSTSSHTPAKIHSLSIPLPSFLCIAIVTARLSNTVLWVSFNLSFCRLRGLQWHIGLQSCSSNFLLLAMEKQ
jgi:hypothetical protein